MILRVQAQHTNISIDDLLLSSYAESTPAFTQKKAPPLVHYIAVEHKLQAVILYVNWRTSYIANDVQSEHVVVP